MSRRANPIGASWRSRRAMPHTPYPVPRTPNRTGFVPPWGDRPQGRGASDERSESWFSPRPARHAAHLVLCAVLACLVLVQAATALAQQNEEPPTTFTWSVRPTPTEEYPERVNFAYDMPAGSIVRDSIRVRNFGNEVLPLVIYATDALTTPSGSLDLLPAGEEPTGAGLWITLEPPTAIAPGQGLLLVPGQGFVDVPFLVTVPENAESGDHVGGIVTSYLTEGSEGPVMFDHRLAIRVQIRVEGELLPSLEVSELTTTYHGTLNPFSAGVVQAGYTVTNTGNVRLAADQVVRTRGLFGILSQEATLESMPELLPGDSLRFSVEVPGVWPTFRTSTEVEVTPTAVRADDSLTLEPATASIATWSIPWSQLGLLLLIAAIVLLRIWSQKRAKRHAQEQTDQAEQVALMVQEAVAAALAVKAAESTTSEISIETNNPEQETNEQ